MGFNCGIVGLPNVGKSTLFNALTSTALAETANYPFCTIEPNSGRVSVPDPRLGVIAEIANSTKIIPTYLEFVDIAGLVKGASNGEGLGNKFLANIREVDAIIHVLRCFADSNITHVDKTLDPVRDAEIVETELMLADLSILERRAEIVTKKAKSGEVDATEELKFLEVLIATLRKGNPIRSLVLDEGDKNRLDVMKLLTSKPILYLSNVEEEAASNGNEMSEIVSKFAETQRARSLCISAQIEAEVSQLDNESEKTEFLAAIGLEETGLHRLIKTGYSLLNLITYFTASPKEARAWTLAHGTTALKASGRIHTDFERGFICAETISMEDYLNLGGEYAAKLAGKMRQEGREYIVQEGDIILYRFNV